MYSQCSHSNNNPFNMTHLREIFRKESFLSLIIFAALLAALLIQQPYLKLNVQVIVIAYSAVMAAAYRAELRRLAKLLFGIVLGYGSMLFGVIVYMQLPNEEVERSASNRTPPPQRFDVALFGPLLGLFVLALVFIYYYRFRKGDDTLPEKYFSYALLIGLCAISGISLFLK